MRVVSLINAFHQERLIKIVTNVIIMKHLIVIYTMRLIGDSVAP